MEEDPQVRPSVEEMMVRLERLSPQRRQPAVHSLHTPLVEKKPVELEKKEIPASREEGDGDGEEAMSEELRQLLELAQTKFGKSSGYSYSSSLHSQVESEATVAQDDIHVVCPRCDSVFVVTAEGEARCPNCSGEFEVDEDGDVIYEYGEDEGEEEK